MNTAIKPPKIDRAELAAKAKNIAVGYTNSVYFWIRDGNPELAGKYARSAARWGNEYFRVLKGKPND